MTSTPAVRINRTHPAGYSLLIAGVIIAIFLQPIIGLSLIIVGLCLREHLCGACRKPVTRHDDECPHCRAEILLPPILTPTLAAIVVAAIAITARLLRPEAGADETGDE